MATISNTPRPGYVWDSTDNVWYPIGVGGHGHTDYITQATAVNPTIIDAKGDIITATAADTPARLAVGNNGETLVADSSTSTGLRYQANFAAGKNKIINGDFNVWQRGTSITPSAGAVVYTADRFFVVLPSGSTVSRQTFTPGTAPVAGYEGQFYMNTVITANAQNYESGQRIENARTFAGQTVTFSFWARSTVGAQTMNILLQQNFGTGGSPSAVVDGTLISSSTGNAQYTPTGTWTRYWFTYSMPSVSGKTFGTNNDSYLQVRPFQYTATTTNTSIDIWGVQVEAGSVATAFQTATGTIQGELAACQRYYQRKTSVGNATLFGMGQASSTTQAYYSIPIPVSFRVAPSVAHSSAAGWTSSTGSAGGTIAAFQMSADSVSLQISGGSGLVAGNASALVGTSGSAYLELSAEL
jgi:hypothetical protein